MGTVGGGAGSKIDMEYAESCGAIMGDLYNKSIAVLNHPPEDLHRNDPLSSIRVNEILNRAVSIGGGGDGVKFDKDKTRWELLPLDVLEGVAKVLTFGAKKYSDDNWKKVEPSRYFSAMMRHYVEMNDNPRSVDKESQLLHSYHFLCCAMFLTWFDQETSTSTLIDIINERKAGATLYAKANYKVGDDGEG